MHSPFREICAEFELGDELKAEIALARRRIESFAQNLEIAFLLYPSPSKQKIPDAVFQVALQVPNYDEYISSRISVLS